MRILCRIHKDGGQVKSVSLYLAAVVFIDNDDFSEREFRSSLTSEQISQNYAF